MDLTFLHNNNRPPFKLYENYYLDRAGSADSGDSTNLDGFTNGTLTANTDLTNVRTGTTSLQMTITDNQYSSTRFDQFPFSFPNGTVITISCYVKCAATVRYAVGFDSDFSDTGSTYGTGDWVFITHSVTITDSTYSVRPMLITRGADAIGTVSAYFDDITVTVDAIEKPSTFDSYFGAKSGAFGYFC